MKIQSLQGTTSSILVYVSISVLLHSKAYKKYIYLEKKIAPLILYKVSYFDFLYKNIIYALKSLQRVKGSH